MYQIKYLFYYPKMLCCNFQNVNDTKNRENVKLFYLTYPFYDLPLLNNFTL